MIIGPADVEIEVYNRVGVIVDGTQMIKFMMEHRNDPIVIECSDHQSKNCAKFAKDRLSCIGLSM